MIKIWTSIGFIAQVLLGNVCMMPMAFAASMPAAPESHMEMVMTPIIPMSPLHCDQCVTVTPMGGDLFSGKTSCAGHCLSQSDIAVVGTFSPAPLPDSTSVLSVFSVTYAPCDMSQVAARAIDPSLAYLIDTTVLRL